MYFVFVTPRPVSDHILLCLGIFGPYFVFTAYRLARDSALITFGLSYLHNALTVHFYAGSGSKGWPYVELALA